MKALNFYSTVYHGFLVSRDKTCTIRLGDKTGKYSEGDVVLVTYGERYKKRKKVFTAVLDRVTVKTIGELTQRELQGESLDMHTAEDALEFLSRVYGHQLNLDDTVTVVHFSEITE